MKGLLIACSLFVAVPIAYPGAAHAGEYSAVNVTITSMGCQSINGVCYVTVSGGPYGPPSCQSNSIRWDSGTTPNGVEAVAQLTAAMVSGLTVSFNLDNNCFSEQSQFPTMDYYIVNAP